MKGENLIPFVLIGKNQVKNVAKPTVQKPKEKDLPPPKQAKKRWKNREKERAFRKIYKREEKEGSIKRNMLFFIQPRAKTPG